MSIAATAGAAPASASIVPLSPGRVALRRALRHPGAWVGGVILLVFVLAALGAPLLTPYDPGMQDLSRRLVPPVWAASGGWDHPLGTDQLGRDTLALLLYGGRISLLVGFATIVTSILIGATLGVAAGYWGGAVDHAVTFLLTVRLTLPVVLVALVAVSVLGQSLPLLVIVIGGLLWDRLVIVTRTATQQIAGQEFVTAARAIGSSTPRILLCEILPNIMSPLIVIGTIELARAILMEATLTFLGLGVQPPLTSWGLMVADAKSQFLFRPWLIAIPGTALVLLILSINLLGDALRDVTAPEGRA
ncbi:ABC transporter permease [Inquilinus limosus]|uniref:Peptide ABC transporter permease n=1 Tax=Inquilinus limosus MP06 TaxID=1398085 RepID=A0A0A0DDZ8_9PROT|nr:ABC transporter permease [Inquilinus limosus]KGM35227.1 peptide ABC transporter permease [Inquilinus limosus MP06]